MTPLWRRLTSFSLLSDSRGFGIATTVVDDPTSAWFVTFSGGIVGNANKVSSGFRAWCVRGGQVFDGNTHDTLH